MMNQQRNSSNAQSILKKEGANKKRIRKQLTNMGN
jgi:hypothetical protein